MLSIQLMIVGAQKAATSSWLRYIAQHPGVATHRKQDMNYFTDDQEYAAGYEQAYRRYFEEVPPDSLLVGKAAGLMYVPEAVERLCRHNQEMLLLVSLRNPIDRAYSAYWYAKRRGIEPMPTFEAALKAEPERLKDGFHKNRLLIYMKKGEYADYIDSLYEYFPRHHVQLVLVDDLKQDPVCAIKHVYTALPGLDNGFSPVISGRHNASAQPRSKVMARLLWSPSSSAGLKSVIRRMLPAQARDSLRARLVRMNERSFRPPPMSPETRWQLAEHFRPFNDRLAGLLQRDLSHWHTFTP